MFSLSDFFYELKIEVDVNSIVQAVILAMFGGSILLMWIGIVKAYRMPRNEENSCLEWSIYLILLTVLTVTFTSFLGLPTKISPLFIEISVYTSLAFLLAFIIIVASERVRTAFIESTFLASFFSNRNQVASYQAIERTETFTKPITRAIKPPHVTMTHNTVTAIDGEDKGVSILGKTVEEKWPRLEEGIVKREEPIDPDYAIYKRWINDRFSRPSEISYGEFSKIREVVNSTMGEEVFGMSEKTLDIPSLSLLARIDDREDVEMIKNFAGGRYFKKLREFGLISEHGRLMAKGVKLVKALKREGLIEKLQEQTKY